MKVTVLQSKKSPSLQKQRKPLRLNVREYENIILNDSFLKGDNYYAMDSMFNASDLGERISL